MSDLKTTNRGGHRPNSGRKSSFETDKLGRRKGGRPVGTTTTGSDYKLKLNPLKEMEGLYKELKKVTTKDGLLIVQAKIDLLNKMLPYAVEKKPTASLDTGEQVIPDMTILKLKSGGETEPKKDIKTISKDDGGDFV